MRTVMKTASFDGVVVIATWDGSNLTLVVMDPDGAERFAMEMNKHAAIAANQAKEVE